MVVRTSAYGPPPQIGDAAKTAQRDWLRALDSIAPIAAQPRRLLLQVIEDLARTSPGAPALISSIESFTYGALAARANAYARWAIVQRIAEGEIVCLMMPNRPEYMAVWLGLSAIGIVVALINTQLRGSSLAHCIDTVAPTHMIVAAEFSDRLQSLAASLKTRPRIWSHGANDAFERIDQAVAGFSGSALSASERRSVTIADRALLIYTSGTTGLPKAANVSHRRVLLWSFWFAGLINSGPRDRIYNCLPMYHSIGGIVATGAALVRGGSVLIRDKFSAQQFWDDIADGGCTIFQYIGELARYLVNAPPHPREREHPLRLACGNGLRGDVWEKFQTRFAVPRILEFYASTEGNFSLYNVEGRVGAIGRVPTFLRHRFPLALVKFDEEAGAPVRGTDGLCVRCLSGEVGEALGRIRGGSSGIGSEFEGYSEAAHSEQKILHHVFEKGDAWYRTGDLMRVDESGFYYFVDRIGDTFRWKGENVSTSEVAAAISAFPGVVEANVYGVCVPGTEGAAGMAAIVSAEDLDLAKLSKHLTEWLPSYARPLFLRLVGQLEATATFKHTKANLQREGFDPTATSDPIYFDDPAEKAFVRLDKTLFERIAAGGVRL
jgi:fatty-acyl-CoA synthase